MKPILFLLATLCTSVALAQTPPLPSGTYIWETLPVERLDTRERRAILEGSTTALDHLVIHATTLDPGQAPHASHTHEDLEELVIVKDGQLRVTIGEEQQVLGPGSIALALPGDEHGFENAGETPATYYVFRYRSKKPMDARRGQDAGGSFMVNWNDVEYKTHDKGGRRQHFDRATTMFERFEMHVTTLNAGLQSHPPHTHDPEEFILVLEGDVEEYIDAKTYPGTAGDLVFLASQSLHGITNTGDTPATYFAFQWE